jgi:hypothetical protein
MTYIYVHIKLSLNIKLSIVQCHLTKYSYLQCTKSFQYIRILPEHVVRKRFSFKKCLFVIECVLMYSRAPVCSDLVSVVSVIRGLPRPPQKIKIKEINGS